MCYAVGSATAAEVYISEYVEGTGNTKAVELHNPTAFEISLDGAYLQWHHNAATYTKAKTFDLELDGRTIAPGGTLAVC